MTKGIHSKELYILFYPSSLLTGLDSKESHSIVSSAETCSHEDVYHFDAIERFFLVSCVSLWLATIYHMCRIILAATQ